MYAEKGYLNVEIEPEMKIPEQESTIFEGKAKDIVRDVVFNISENEKVKIGNKIKSICKDYKVKFLVNDDPIIAPSETFRIFSTFSNFTPVFAKTGV